MYPISESFKTEALKKDRELQAKIVIGGVKVFEDTSIIEFSVLDSVDSQEDFTVGEAISSKLTASIRTKIPFMDGERVEPFLRFRTESGYTEYMPLGVFTIDSRVNKNNVWNIVAYDDLTSLLIPYESQLTYPASMVDIMNEIKAQLNLTFDSSITINPSFTVAYNNNTDPPTIRDVIRWIAGVHLCSVRMTKEGKLGWVKFNPNPSVRTDISYFKLDKLNSSRTITKVIVTNSAEGETVYIEKGSGGAYNTLTFENPYMTPEYLDNVFSQINGFTYVPYVMSIRGLPYLEVADSITFQRDESLTWLDIEIPWENYNAPWDGLVTYNSLILSSELVYKKGLLQNLSAKTRSEKENEYEFTGTLNSEIKRLKRNAVQESKLYNGVKITRQNGMEVIRSDGKVEVSLNATEGFRIQSDRGQGYLEDALYIDTNGNLKLHGDSIISFGDISDVPDFVTQGDLSDYVTETGLTTMLGQDYIVTGKILADKIRGGTLSGVTIEVDDDVFVGDNIYLGDIYYGIRLENDNGNFYLRRANTRVMKFWSNGMWVNGHIALSREASIGLHDGLDGSTWAEKIKFHWDGGISIYATGANINIGSAGYSPTINIYGYMRHRGNQIGFFDYSPQYQKNVYYAANDTNAELKTKLNALIQRLGEYGLIYPRN